MRRPVMYLAGLLMATGASLALAGPASAAPSHCHDNHHSDWWGASDDSDYWRYHSSTSNNVDNHSRNYGVNLLTGNSSLRNGGLLGIL
jgi:hypothetical protein